MRTNIALATLSSLILVAQTYFLATLLDKLIMQNVDRGDCRPADSYEILLRPDFS